MPLDVNYQADDLNEKMLHNRRQQKPSQHRYLLIYSLRPTDRQATGKSIVQSFVLSFIPPFVFLPSFLHSCPGCIQPIKQAVSSLISRSVSLVGWLVSWSVSLVGGWSVWSVGRSVWSVGWASWLVGWLGQFGWSVGLASLVGRLVGPVWLVGWSVSWSAWSVGWFSLIDLVGRFGRSVDQSVS